MNKDRIWHLAGKKLAGEASSEEMTELEGLLRSDPDMHYALQNITDIWKLQPRATDIEDAFQHHTQRMKAAGIDWPSATGEQLATADIEYPFPYRSRSRKKLILSLAAIAVIALAGFLLFYPGKPGAASRFLSSNSSTAVTEKNEISTRNGSKSKVMLPDGTQVWLNAGSHLIYNKEFGNGLREVELSGEAFFDVVKNEQQPFIIHTKQIDVRVVGTAFNVKSYPGDKSTETTLIRGKVEVLIKSRPDEVITLKPNEKLVVVNDDVDTVATEPKAGKRNEPMVSLGKLNHYPNNESLVVETAWVDNKLVFDNESFSDVVAKMERWYNVEFEFKEESLKNLHFTGVFTTETIQQALNAMSITAEFSYTIDGNIVIVAKRY